MTSQELPAQTSASPNILLSLGWIIVYFALQFICQLILMIGFNVVDLTTMGTMTPEEQAALLTTPGFAMVTLWGLVISGALTLLILWLVHRRPDAMPPVKTEMPLLRLIGLAVVLLGFSYGFNYLYQTYVIPGVESQKLVTDMLKAVPKDMGSQALMVFAIAIMAPIVEELLFRWGLQNALMRRMGPWAAISISAFVFALVHGQPAAIPMLFIMGAVFGYLYYRSGSIRTTIALHIVNNGLAALFLHLYPNAT